MRPWIYARKVVQPPDCPDDLVCVELPANCVVVDANFPHGPRWSAARIFVEMREDGAYAIGGDYLAVPA